MPEGGAHDPLDDWLEKLPPGGAVDYALVRYRLQQVERRQLELDESLTKLMSAIRDTEVETLKSGKTTGDQQSFSMRIQRPAWIMGGLAIILQTGTFIVVLVNSAH